MIRRLGYDPGPLDGMAGTRTKAAVRAYQRDAGIDDDGRVDAGLLARLKATPSLPQRGR